MKNLPNITIVCRWLLLICLAASLCALPASPARSQAVCFANYTPGTTSISGIINSYFPGTANAAVGATTITVGTGRGANVDINVGDLLLVTQMQDASIDGRNTARYGSGANSGAGSGYTNPNNTGRYEYVVARSAITYASGGSLTIRGTGTGGGLLYAYTNANATTSAGQRRFQVIRVPAYLNASLGGMLTAESWNGSTGGVLALEVVTELIFNGNAINVDRQGFRGGGGRQLGGGGGSNTDYRTLSTVDNNGAKGEGIAGTPRYVYYGGVLVDTTPPTGTDGYPNGSNARGAPGTAGGGGTDGEPANNEDNSGGGGGGNGGAGGLGGNSWQSNEAIGGRLGVAFAERGAGRLVLGGGGGSGTTNNGTGTPAAGLASSGGAGGGMILIRARQMSGTGNLSANGANTLIVENDSTGGAGAGGSILMVLNTGNNISGLTVSANGGNGGNAWPTEAPGTFPGSRHGPGGGGGGGVAYLSTVSGVTPAVTGGTNGTTTTANEAYGATPGAAGTSSTTTYTSVPGVTPGFLCFTPTAIDLVSLQARSQPGMSWAWLALPAVLGLLMLALRRRRGKAE